MLSGNDLNSLTRLYMMKTFAENNKAEVSGVIRTWEFWLINRKHHPEKNTNNELYIQIGTELLEDNYKHPLTFAIKHFGDVSLKYNPY